MKIKLLSVVIALVLCAGAVILLEDTKQKTIHKIVENSGKRG